MVGGGAVGVLAAGSRRSIAPHARLHLRHPDTSATGRPGDIARTIEAQSALQGEFVRLLAERTGRPVLEIEEEWSRGGYLDAPSAIALGYADSLSVPGGAIPRPGRRPWPQRRCDCHSPSGRSTNLSP